MDKLEKLFFGCLSLFFLDISLLFMYLGRMLYGKDATLLWAMGMVSFMGIMGISNFIGNFGEDKHG